MSTTNGHVQIVTFRLRGDLFAADVHGVERVLRRQDATPVPNVPDWIIGVIEYQKRVVPVIDLRVRFEMDAVEPTNETRVLVFNAYGAGEAEPGSNRPVEQRDSAASTSRGAAQWIAGVVDAVLDVAVVDRTTVQPPPELFRGLAGEYLKGIVRRDNKLVMLLDVTKLLTATERLALELVDA